MPPLSGLPTHLNRRRLGGQDFKSPDMPSPLCRTRIHHASPSNTHPAKLVMLRVPGPRLTLFSTVQQVNETEREEVLTRAKTLRTWLEERVAEQAEQPAHLAPMFTVAQVKRRRKRLTVRGGRLHRVLVPCPVFGGRHCTAQLPAMSCVLTCFITLVVPFPNITGLCLALVEAQAFAQAYARGEGGEGARA